MKLKNILIVGLLFFVPKIESFLELDNSESLRMINSPIGVFNLLDFTSYRFTCHNSLDKIFSRLKNNSQETVYKIFRVVFRHNIFGRVFEAQEIVGLERILPGQTKEINGNFRQILSQDGPSCNIVGYFITNSDVVLSSLNNVIGDFLFKYDYYSNYSVCSSIALISDVCISGRYNSLLDYRSDCFLIDNILTVHNGLFGHLFYEDIFMQNRSMEEFIYDKLVLVYGDSLFPQRYFESEVRRRA